MIESSSSNSPFEVRPCAKPEEFADALQVTKLAFADYKLFLWQTKRIPEEALNFVSFVCTVVSAMCAPPRGIVFACIDKSSTNAPNHANDSNNNNSNDDKIVGAASMNFQPALSENRLIAAVQKTVRFVQQAFTIGSLIRMAPFNFVKHDVKNRESVKRFECMLELDAVRNRHVGFRDHMYLIQLACHPEFQGRGVGSALLNALCKLADDRQQPLWLETDETHLSKYYAKFGFKVVEEYEVGRSLGDVFVPNYGMLREPAEKRA